MQPATLESQQRLAAIEAVRLSGQLQSVAKQLPLGLDAAAVAQTLLDEVYAVAPVDVCAVLLRVDEDTASPLALRGATRLPWRDPIRSEGALHQGWCEQSLVLQVRDADAAGPAAGLEHALRPTPGRPGRWSRCSSSSGAGRWGSTTSRWRRVSRLPKRWPLTCRRRALR